MNLKFLKILGKIFLPELWLIASDWETDFNTDGSIDTFRL